MRDVFLLNQNAKTWNMLPSEIAEADTLNQFKARLDKHMTLDSEVKHMNLVIVRRENGDLFKVYKFPPNL